MQKPFPPGATDSRPSSTPSRWREFEFMFHELCKAIEPDFSLGQTLEQWPEIRDDLSEAHRTRRPQCDDVNRLTS